MPLGGIEMSNTLVRSQMEQVETFLDQVTNKMADYLDNHNLKELQQEVENENQDYFRHLLATLRRLEVFCKEAQDAVEVILKSEVFRKSAAEKTLYVIYHQCISEFFSPKEEPWYEDSRAAYTGKNAIRFYKDAPPSFSLLIGELEKPFQDIREELAYYETDYRTKIVMHDESETPS